MRTRRWLRALAVVVPSLLGTACGGSDDPPPRLEVPKGPEVWLVSFGASKIAAIQAVREVTGLGLADAKALVERAPVLVTRAGDRAEAEAHAKRLRDAGATVEIR